MADIDLPVDPAPAPTPQPTDPAPQPADPGPGDPPPADPAPPPAPDPTGYWPEDWRQKYAKDDPKVLKRLERYASPDAALDALFAAQSKIASGQLKFALKPDATPEELAAWREENGIPAEPKDYEINLPNGMVVGEADKPMVDEFLTEAHKANMSPEQVNQALAWYLGKQESAQVEMIDRDHERATDCIVQLKEEYGPEYKRNLAAAVEFIPEGIRDELLVARGPDGTKLGDNPQFIRWVVQTAKELNPTATVVPGSGQSAVSSIQSELAALTKLMGDHDSEYWKGPNAAKNQARALELANALERSKKAA